MFPLELQQEAAKTIVMDGVVKPLSGMFGDLLKNSFTSGSSQVWQCTDGSQYKNSEVGAGFSSCSQGKKYYQTGVNNGISACGGGSGGNSNPTGGSTGCVLRTVGGSGPAGSETPEERARREAAANDPMSGVSPEQRQRMNRADAACNALRGGQGLQGTQFTDAQMLNTQAGKVAEARNSLSGGTGVCGAETVSRGASADGQLVEAETQLGNAVSSLSRQNATGTTYARPTDNITKAETAIREAERLIGAAKTALTTPVAVPPLAAQTPDAYFAQATNPFAGRGDSESWYTQFKEAHGPLQGTITTMEGRLGRLKVVAGEVNLLAGETDKPGVVQRSVQANSAYTAAKTVIDAAEGAPAQTAYNTAKTAIQAAPPVLQAAGPAGTGAVDPVRGNVTQFITTSQQTAPKVTTADQALMRYVGAEGAPTTPLQAPATAKSEATRLVTELGTAVGTSMEANGLRKSAATLVSTVQTNLNNSRTGQAQ